MSPDCSASNCLVRNNYSGVGAVFMNGLLVNSTIVSNYGVGIFSYTGTIRNCLVAYNDSRGIWNLQGGPGLFQNCTVAGNGDIGISLVEPGMVENCIVYDNVGGNYNAGVGSWTNSCTTPMPTGTYDTGNITNAPAFANQAAGNFRLSAASPCIGRGIYRDWMTNAVDLDGRIRIRYGMVDMGAYEFIHAGTIISFH